MYVYIRQLEILFSSDVMTNVLVCEANSCQGGTARDYSVRHLEDGIGPGVWSGETGPRLAAFRLAEG